MIASQEAVTSSGQSASRGTGRRSLKSSASARHARAETLEPELNAAILEIGKNSTDDSIGT